MEERKKGFYECMFLRESGKSFAEHKECDARSQTSAAEGGYATRS